MTPNGFTCTAIVTNDEPLGPKSLGIIAGFPKVVIFQPAHIGQKKKAKSSSIEPHRERHRSVCGCLHCSVLVEGPISPMDCDLVFSRLETQASTLHGGN